MSGVGERRNAALSADKLAGFLLGSFAIVVLMVLCGLFYGMTHETVDPNKYMRYIIVVCSISHIVGGFVAAGIASKHRLLVAYLAGVFAEMLNMAYGHFVLKCDVWKAWLPLILYTIFSLIGGIIAVGAISKRKTDVT